MGLYARITTEGPGKVSVHRLGAALRQWAAGELTRAQVIAAFEFTGSDVTELDAIKAAYDAMGTGTIVAGFAKAAWLDRLEDVFLLCETGDYPESKARSALGF